ncbi:hypothetical protein IWQ62_001488 [Dispira parvispora]|uniref:RING-type E3 ubiquitin transferase n=1 Tax=Dispira parvispora TaxID=1520584 RepID=A0A9W8AXQ8_9FUNG|nr:hypothetical protein IWQ62_001488 [Dispira parvispora]
MADRTPSKSTNNPSRPATQRRRRGKEPAADSEHETVDSPAGTSRQSKGKHGSRSRASAVDEKDLCFICAHKVQYAAFGPCDHPTCHVCSLRLRALYANKTCPYCKTELDTVAFVKHPAQPFAQYHVEKFPFHDESLGIAFETKEIRNRTRDLLALRCQWRGCNYEAPKDWNDLRRHVSEEHGMHLCDLCVRFKKAFAHEHRLFTKPHLTSHYRKGDKAGFPGHPNCDFCQHAFYDNDHLYEHCRDRHEQCHICLRNGTGRHQYYRNYNALEHHFRSEHFLCAKSSCLEKKFVVFESDIDLQAHMLEEHSPPGAGQRAAQRQHRQITTHFSYNRQRAAERRERFDRTTPTFVDSHDSPLSPSSADDHPPSRTHNATFPDEHHRSGANVSSAVRRAPTGFGQLSQVTAQTPAPSEDRTEPATLSPTLGDSVLPTGVNQPRPAGVPTLSSIVQGGFDNQRGAQYDWPTLGDTARTHSPGTSGSTHSNYSRVATKPKQTKKSGKKGKGTAQTNGVWNTPVSTPSPRVEAPTVSRPSNGASSPDPLTLQQHAEILNQVDQFVGHQDPKVGQFRRLTTDLRREALPSAKYIDAVWALRNPSLANDAADTLLRTIVEAVGGALQNSTLQRELAAGLKRHNQSQQEFPDLGSLQLDRNGPGTDRTLSPTVSKGARVLIVKPSNKPRLAKGTWRPSTTKESTKPTTRTFLSITSPPGSTSQRKGKGSNSGVDNPWGKGSSSKSKFDDETASTSSQPSSSKSKKQVLLHFG